MRHVCLIPPYWLQTMELWIDSQHIAPEQHSLEILIQRSCIFPQNYLFILLNPSFPKYFFETQVVIEVSFFLMSSFRI